MKQLDNSNRWAKSAVPLLLLTCTIILAVIIGRPLQAQGDSFAFLPFVTGDGPNSDGGIIPFGQTFNGEGTYYFGTGEGACLFPPIPGNLTVPLLEPLIRYGCPSNGLVIDPFAGSCSTLLACRELGIPAVGIERHEPSAEAAAKRLSALVLGAA